MTHDDQPEQRETRSIGRRGFLRYGAIGGALALAGPIVSGCGSDAQPDGSHTALPHTPSQTPPPFELEEATVAELQDAMRSGKYTAHAITQLYLSRIDALDKQGPSLHLVIETNPEALRIADELDAERKAKGP